MASTANHFSPFLSLSAKQTASPTTPKLNTNSSHHLHCFQSSKFLSPLNQKCVSVVSSAGQGRRSLRVCADLARVMDTLNTKEEHGVPTIVEVDFERKQQSYYPIYIGSGLLDKPDLLQRHVRGDRVIVVTNNTVAPLYLDKVAGAIARGNPNISVESVILPDGEQYKDICNVIDVTDWASRIPGYLPSTYVALGGGVIGDVCGSATALFRGRVNFIQIPTTFIAQVDSSVGDDAEVYDIENSPTYVDCEPHSVLIDIDTLNTLPDRELASGFAEVIKYGLIRDAQFFEWLEKNMQSLMARDPSALSYAIKRSCEIKAEVMAPSFQSSFGLEEIGLRTRLSFFREEESRLRTPLNLGHTFGKAIETKGGYGHKWLHGEAVAAGMVMAVDLSHRLGWIDDSIVQRVHAILKQANLPTAPPENMTVDMFKSFMMRHEKVTGRFLRLILPRGPLGNCVYTWKYNKKAFETTLHKFCKS